MSIPPDREINPSPGRPGTPVLFVPGLLCSAEVFSPQVSAMWRHGPVSVASTLQGGTMDEMAAAILETAPPRFALAGLSMGGYIALAIVRQAPDRVLKLALLDTSARSDTEDQIARRRTLLTRADAGAEAFETLLSEMMPALLHPSRRHDTRLLATCMAMGRAVGPAAFARQIEAIIGRADSRPLLPRITVPTVVIVGDQDPVTPPARAEELATGIRGARLVRVPDCGHVSTLERPDAVNRALVDWIGS